MPINSWAAEMAAFKDQFKGTRQPMSPGVDPKAAPVAPKLGERDKYALSIGQQQDDVNYLRGLSDIYAAQPSQMDLSPLLKFIDSFEGGGNIAAGYQRPETPEERLLNIAKMRNLATDGQGDITKDQLGLLKEMFDVSRQTNNDFKAGDRVRTEIQNIDKIVDSKLMQVQRLQDSFADGSIQKVRQAITSLARTINEEKGNASDKDAVRQYMTTLQGQLKQLQAYVTSDPNEKLPEKLLMPLRETVDQASEIMYDVLKGKKEQARKTLNSRRELRDYMNTSGNMMLDALDDRIGEFRTDPMYDRPKGVPPYIWVKAAPELRESLVNLPEKQRAMVIKDMIEAERKK